MTVQPDFFGGNHPVQIRDNAILERACNRLLNMVKDSPELLDGDTMGEINARVYAELLWEDCFKILISPEKKTVFVNACLKAPNAEVYTRAIRFLLSKDAIRVSSSAIKSAEQYKHRIGSSLK